MVSKHNHKHCTYVCKKTKLTYPIQQKMAGQKKSVKINHMQCMAGLDCGAVLTTVVVVVDAGMGCGGGWYICRVGIGCDENRFCCIGGGPPAP